MQRFFTNHPASALLVALAALAVSVGCAVDDDDIGARGPFAERVSVYQDISLQECDCFFWEWGYPTAADCRADVASYFSEAGTQMEVACFDDVYDPNSGLASSLLCMTEALDEELDCLRSAACEQGALNVCYARADFAAGECPMAPAGAFDALAAAAGLCVQERVVGESSEQCPDKSVSGTGPVAVVDTVGEGDDTWGDCGGWGAADVSLAWTAPQSGVYLIDTEGSRFDTVLYVRDGCLGPELACNDDRGIDLMSEVVLTLEAGQQVVIVVDGYSSECAGRAQLNITRL